METHPDPANAMSDGPNAWPLDRMESLLTTLVDLDRTVKEAGFEEMVAVKPTVFIQANARQMLGAQDQRLQLQAQQQARPTASTSRSWTPPIIRG